MAAGISATGSTIMPAKNEEVEVCRRALEAKRLELIGRQHNAESIIIERVADAADESVLANQRDLAVDALNREAAVLRLVTEALELIATGEYGFCIECGERISSKRLAALPWAALCLKCQEVADRPDRTSGPRPKSWFQDAA
jgi:RNA polymerase-binding transcription factor